MSRSRTPPWLVRPLHDWLLVTHLVAFALPVLVLVGTGALATDLRRQTVDDIAHQAVLVALHIEDRLASADAPGPAALDSVAGGLSPLLSTAKVRTLAGYRVVDAEGRVIASSNGATGDSLADEPEVANVIASARNNWWWEERDNGHSMRTPLAGPSRRASVRMFVAEPIIWRGAVLGAVVVSRTPREELQAFWHMAPRLSVGVFLGLAFTVGLAVVSGRVLSRSLRSLSAASHRMAAGDLDAIGDLAMAQTSRVLEARDLAGAMGSMATRLQTRLKYIGEFASHVSHEFKTPVSSLRGTVELLLDDDEMPPATRERFLTNALADLDRLTRMVSGLLRLARAEEGGGPRVVAVEEVVRGVLERHAEVRVEGAGGLVDANADQIGMAVHNLLENARRYGGPEPTIVLRLWADEHETGVEVEDDGPGISEANLPQVFDRFFTTGRERGGTGLGLALVRAIVQAHGGQVSVQSRPGRTVFRLGLPKA